MGEAAQQLHHSLELAWCHRLGEAATGSSRALPRGRPGNGQTIGVDDLIAMTQTIVAFARQDCWPNPTLSTSDGGGLQKTMAHVGLWKPSAWYLLGATAWARPPSPIASARYLIGAIARARLAFARWLFGLPFDVNKLKRSGTTPPPSYSDRAVLDPCATTATTTMTTAAAVATTKVSRSHVASFFTTLEGQDLDVFWSKSGGSHLTMFIVRGDV